MQRKRFRRNIFLATESAYVVKSYLKNSVEILKMAIRENVGMIRDLILRSFVTANPFALGKYKFSMGLLKPHTMQKLFKSIMFKLELLNVYSNATPGAYTIPVDIKISDIVIRKYITLRISKACPDVKYVVFNPSRIYQGLPIALMNLTIINLCEAIAKNVTIKIDLPKGFELLYKNLSKITFDNLPPGQQIPIIIPFKVDEDVKPGRYYAKLSIRWSNGEVKKKVIINLVKDVKTGDYLIVHAGFAIQKLDEKEALETLKLLKEMEE